jgi:hypothetical protein
MSAGAAQARRSNEITAWGRDGWLGLLRLLPNLGRKIAEGRFENFEVLPRSAFGTLSMTRCWPCDLSWPP